MVPEKNVTEFFFVTPTPPTTQDDRTDPYMSPPLKRAGDTITTFFTSSEINKKIIQKGKKNHLLKAKKKKEKKKKRNPQNIHAYNRKLIIRLVFMVVTDEVVCLSIIDEYGISWPNTLSNITVYGPCAEDKSGIFNVRYPMHNRKKFALFSLIFLIQIMLTK